MSLDTGDWSYRGTAPGFVKKFCRGVRRILKRHHAKKNRQEAKRQCEDIDRATQEVPIGESSHNYDGWTRYTPYQRGLK